MAYNPNNPNGQATMANSSPVVLASDQVVPISDNSSSITVDANNLDIRDLTSTDVVTVTGGAGQTADVKITLDSEQVAISNFPATQPVSGTVTVTQSTGSNLNANVTVQNASIPVTDNGGSLTVDNAGTFAVQAAQSGTWTLGSNSGVDIGDVTINNTGGASAVNIQDGGNTITVDGTVTVTDGLNVEGDVAHDSIDSGNPLKVGAKAIAHGTNPTAVAAADRTDLYANRAGVLFTIGGHPNIITRAVYISDATGAQTDTSIVGTIAAGTKVAVTSVAVTVDSATTAAGGVAVKLGFGATTIPADSATGANGILLDHKGIAAGSGVVIGNGSGLLGIGADGEELRLTCEDPVGGGLSVTISYYTIES
jgi:hypothetical protein